MTTSLFARISCLATVAAAALAIVGAGSAAGDPRVCSPGGKPMAKRTCAHNLAFYDLEQALAVRMGYRGPWQGDIVCRGDVSMLRWVCSFRNPAEHGAALILLGSPPAWRPVVTVKELACTVKTDRPGCAFPY